MIDLRKKIIFIHIHKVAGKSISTAMENNYIPKLIQNNEYFRWKYKKYFLRNTIFTKRDSLTTHSYAVDYKNYLKKDYKNFFSFAFVRNPLDWQVSMYFYMKNATGHPQHNLINKMSFNEYIEWRCLNEVTFQKDYLVDNNGKLIVDFIGRYENLLLDIRKIEKQSGLIFNLPHLNRSNHENYLKYYNKSSKDLIYKYFKKDFEMLNYE
tara:strand:+ start:45 stop:671 length:627 start_codon:yes stop_codon:yes gene_type:complete